MTNEQIINTIEGSSPEFTDTADAVSLIASIDTYCEQLSENPSQETVQSIEQALKSWEVITVKIDGQTKWLTNPIIIRNRQIKRSLTSRIKHLIQSCGEWKSEYMERIVVESSHMLTIPFKLTVKKEQVNDVPPLLIALIHLRNKIEDIILHETSTSSSIGIFKGPDRIINTNRLCTWLDGVGDHKKWRIKDTLGVTSLYDIVNKSSCTRV